MSHSTKWDLYKAMIFQDGSVAQSSAYSSEFCLQDIESILRCSNRDSAATPSNAEGGTQAMWSDDRY